LIGDDVTVDNTWGCDHGTWSVLCRMYPRADIPVFQLSVDMDAGPAAHFQLGQKISSLREQGVLILASGNVVHNLSRINWDMEGGQPWAVEFDNYIKDQVVNNRYDRIIHYEQAGKSAELAFSTPEHFYPLLYVLGAARPNDKLTVFNDSCTLGSLSMTCYLFG
jgi:4,5-DOPA dioxygenase extradiol